MSASPPEPPPPLAGASGENPDESEPRSVDNLMAVYTVERQDQQHSATLSWTLVTTALVYAGFAITVVDGATDPAIVLIIFAPFPFLAIVGFLAMLSGNVLQRAEYLTQLEAELQELIPNSESGLSVPDAFRRSEWIFAVGRMESNGGTRCTAGTFVWPLVVLTIFIAEVLFVGFAVDELFARASDACAGFALAGYLSAVGLQGLAVRRGDLRPPPRSGTEDKQ